jgi:aspartyl/asparaginyl beta-hydroxylase (cupin superfamily)
MSANEALSSLKDGADRALRNADPRAARELFQRAIDLAPARVDLWMGLAASQRGLGDLAGALAAAESALVHDPRFFPAMLMKGTLLEALGENRQAAVVYGLAAKLAPPSAALAEPTRRALAHAVEVHDRYTAELAANLRAAAGLDGLGAAAARRADVFVEAVAGRRRIYQQEPVQFHFPGMAAVEFYEREAFPWLEALEACTGAIRQELLAVWSEDSPGLTPYVAYAPGAPLDQWAELNNSLKWSAYHFLADGERVEAHCAACPRTMDAIALIDQPQVPGRSPAAMFSILRPRTRIPPHTGIANTRLVLHLPLVVPEGCGFRVGGETRAWREGEAWVFDDTIEHEAWNNGDQPRAVLICDVWSPTLSSEEREMIVRVTAALDRFNGGVVQGGDL